MLKELFKGSAIYGIAPFVPRVLSVLLLPILTKYLTSADYGIIGTIASITLAVQALQDLGLRTILPTYFYRCRSQYKVVWREIYGFLSLWLIAFAFIQAVLLYFFIPAEAEDNKWLIIILSNFSTVLFGPTSIIAQMYYQLNLKPTPIAVRTVAVGIITLLANFLCVVFFRWGYMGAYVASFAGSFFVNMSYWPVLNRELGLSPIYNFKPRTIKRLLKVSMPTIPHYYSAYLMNSSNVVAMNYHDRPIGEVGHLTMAQNITNMLNTLVDSVNQVFGPMCFRNIRDRNSDEMKRLLYTFILLAYSLTFLYSLWSREVYSLLISNEEIAATYKYSIILAMAFCYRPLYVYCCDYFFYHENTIPLLGITFVSGIVSCVFYFTMIPYIGIYAALIGFYLGCLYMGYSGYFYRFYKKNTIFGIRWYLFLALQLGLTGLAWTCVDLIVFIKIGISLCYLMVVGVVFISKIKYHAVAQNI